MNELNDITRQVLYNCDITDSHYAGIYSICTLALGLRNLFKWEHHLEPWIEKNPSEVLEWIDQREQRWERLAEAHLSDISIHGKKYDPFDTEPINAHLESYHLLYGAGYARSIKPTFFLANVDERKWVDGCKVYFLGQELARDLFTCPAQSVSDLIFIRKSSAKAILWDQIFYVVPSGKNALQFALGAYGLDIQNYESIQHHLDHIISNECETYMYHELGEIKDTVFDHGVWQEMMASFPHSPVELFARSVKDLLANTSQQGMLNYIIHEQKSASLGFYIAFMDSLTKKMFSEILEVFDDFTRKENWDIIRKAMNTGYYTARNYAESICDLYEMGKQKGDLKWAENKITTSLIEPLCG